jgi:hypothetical protein
MKEIRKRVPQSRVFRWGDVWIGGVLRLDQVIYAIIDIAAGRPQRLGSVSSPLSSSLWLFILLLQVIIDSSLFFGEG